MFSGQSTKGMLRMRPFTLIVVLVLSQSILYSLPRTFALLISLEEAGASLIPFFKKYGTSTRHRIPSTGNKTLLHIATDHDNVEVLRYVLKQLEARVGKNPKLRNELRLRDSTGRTPLHLVRSAVAARLLLDSGASVVSSGGICIDKRLHFRFY